jgi:hypothetical protein
MSLQINYDRIKRVLLADGWHNCTGFRTDSYEFGYYHEDRDYTSGVSFHLDHGGGQSGVFATGFAFRDDNGDTVAGPLTAILAVRGKGLGDEPTLDEVQQIGR